MASPNDVAPPFTWDAAAISAALGPARYQQGRLAGRLEGLSPAVRAEAHRLALAADVVASSALSGVPQ